MIDLSQLIERVRVKCAGSGEVLVCCHPDVDDQPINHGDRTCVLDTLAGAWACDIASDEKLTDKHTCKYWRARPLIAPEGPTLDEGIALIAEIDRLSAALRAVQSGKDEG